MKKIIFVCHGNICRSPAAEFIAKAYLKEVNRENEFEITSMAVSLEEIGNDIYPPMKEELRNEGIPYERHYASRIGQNDYEKADYIFYMDSSNLSYLNRLINNHKNIIFPINNWTPSISHIEDPWYTDRYKKVCTEIKQCILDIFKNI